MKVSDNCVTSSGKLIKNGVKFIIHVNGPIWSGGNSNEN